MDYERWKTPNFHKHFPRKVIKLKTSFKNIKKNKTTPNVKRGAIDNVPRLAKKIKIQNLP